MEKNKKAKNEQEALSSEIENLVEQRDDYQRTKDDADSNIATYKEQLEKNEEELSKLKDFEEYLMRKRVLKKTENE